MCIRDSTSAVALQTGGFQTLFLDAGPAAAGLPYLVLGSASGTVPGIALGGGAVLPLNPDAYLALTLETPQGPPVWNGLGTFDAAGSALALIAVPPNLNPGLAGLTLHHAWAGLPAWPLPPFASNAAPLTLLP